MDAMMTMHRIGIAEILLTRDSHVIQVLERMAAFGNGRVTAERLY